MFQTGELGVTWFDRRKDPNNIQYQPYSAFSTTSGVSFTTNTALSTTLSNPLHDGFGGTFWVTLAPTCGSAIRLTRCGWTLGPAGLRMKPEG
jgi:hypothetical protein